MKTRIKFCGMTRQQDVQLAVELGVDALGLVFVDKSERNVEIEQAQKLISAIPPFIVKVGLFMNANATDVTSKLQSLNLNLLQFHGDEDEIFCKQFDMPYLKAIPMGSVASIDAFISKFPTATGFLLDSHSQGQMGGSGEKFSWQNVPQNIAKPLILAGGLTPENVHQAKSIVQPYAVDVSSGIETSKGIKDPAKMAKFIKEVHRD